MCRMILNKPISPDLVDAILVDFLLSPFSSVFRMKSAKAELILVWTSSETGTQAIQELMVVAPPTSVQDDAQPHFPSLEGSFCKQMVVTLTKQGSLSQAFGA